MTFSSMHAILCPAAVCIRDVEKASMCDKTDLFLLFIEKDQTNRTH